MSGHTPGPWLLVKHTCAEPQHMTAADDWTVMAANEKAVCIEGWADEAEANARLIAAAPEMLVALRVALGQLEALGGRRRKHPNEGQDEIHAGVLEQIDAALAKATGAAA